MTSISAIGSAPHVSATLASTMSNAAYPLRATIERSGSMVLLRVGGEVDAHNVAMFASLMSQAASATTAPGPLIIDINGLDFIACCGFAAVAEQSVECRRRGISLCLVSNRPSTVRIMAAGKFDAEVSLHQDVQAALESEHQRGESDPWGTAETALVS